MRSSRLGAVCAGFATCAALFGAAPAMATVTHTQITSPGDPYYSIANEANSTETRTVTGTSDGTTGDVVDLRCYQGGSTQSPNPGQDIPVNADGSFSGDVDLFDISDNGHGCILRAVPDGTTPDNTAPYAGPRMLITYFQPPAESGTYQVHGGSDTVSPHWFGAFDGLTASTYMYDVSSDGLYYFSPTNPNTLLNHGWWEGYPPVEYGAALYQGNQDGDASSIRIDSKNAYTVAGLPYADYDGGGPEGNTFPAGVSTPEVSISQDGNGMITILEQQPLYFCSDTTFPPNAARCATVSSAGVRLDRTLQSSDGGKTFTVTDNFVSSDGAQHTVGTNYYNEANNYYNYVLFRMPGEQSGTLHDSGDLFNWQSAPATMFWFDSSDEGTSGSGALTELQKPDSTTWSGYYYWYQNYGSTTVPAGGSASLTHVYQVAFKAAEIEQAAAQQTDKFAAPSVAITSPSDGTLTQNDAVLVSGTATDNTGVKSLTVNGTPTSVGNDGKWSQTVVLNEGQNTITAVAADGAGQSSQASVKVIRGASACKVPTLVGVTKAQAVTALQANGCGIGTEKQVFSGKVKKGDVVAQASAPGTLLVTGTKVDFSVSRGAFPSARLASSKAKLKGNRLTIAVRCASTGSATTGTVKLRKGSKTLGTKSFQCSSGKKRNVVFNFSKKTAAALHKAKKSRVAASIVSHGPNGAAASRRSNLTVLG
jgi:Glucodextranase, domain B/PASTA domain